ncbi:hypothetical protein [Flectobacillus major]|uniref:hypothetical protein n=1 Tax=Flectobacillus major TaxID=103 RepID=UPI0003FC608C|nr:hypothetical protein [Flectobacillus major]
MTPLRKKTFLKKVKDITIGSTIALALLGQTLALQSCSSDSSEDEGDYEEVDVYKKGVKTYITETSKGVFKITKEEETLADSSVAIVSYLDGKQDTLSPRAVKALIDNEIATHPSTIGQSNNLSNALLYGGMGYLLARTMSPSYSNYRPDLNQNGFMANSNTSKRDTARRHRSHYYGGTFSRFYASRQAFQHSNTVHESINHSRTTMYRPIGGRSGFFRGGSHGSFHG